MKKIPLLIFPANGNALEALDCLSLHQYELVGFVDDHEKKQKEGFHGFRVFSREQMWQMIPEDPELRFLAVPGSPSLFREKINLIESLRVSPNRFISLIHPSAVLGKNVQMGRNCLVMAGVVVTSNAGIEEDVCILPQTVIHHDVKIGRGTTIGSQVVIAGGVQVGKQVYLGSGSRVLQGVKIGDGALVGMGAVVIRDVKPLTRVVGNPAREIS